MLQASSVRKWAGREEHSTRHWLAYIGANSEALVQLPGLDPIE